jgi:hypothetical protein
MEMSFKDTISHHTTTRHDFIYYIYIFIYMDLRLATLKAVPFYLLHNVSTLNQCRKFSCVTVVCKHFASYQGTLIADGI